MNKIANQATITTTSAAIQRKNSTRYTFCLYEISKEANGELRQVVLEPDQCQDKDCSTFKTIHQLELRLTHQQEQGCDSTPAERLDGQLYVCDLSHVLARADFNGRGFHGGSFTWVGQQVVATGSLSGITNAGTHREPAFDPACQRCQAPGFMEGRFCGSIRRSADPALVGCQVFGSYRLQFEGTLRERRNPVRGVLEGLIVCECQPAEPPRP